MHHIVQFQAASGAFLIPFLLLPLILLRYFKKIFKDKFGSASVWLRLCSLFTCQNLAITVSIFQRQQWIWIYLKGMLCTDGVKELLLDLPLSDYTLTESPFPGTYSYSCSAHQSQYSLLGQKNQSGAHLRNIREETHRLVPTGCIAN